MLQSRVQGKPAANCTGLNHRWISSTINVLFLCLILASFSVLAIACGDEPSATSAPVGTAAQPVASEPVATAAPEATPLPAATSTPVPAPDTGATIPPEAMQETGALSDDDLTRAYVTRAIEYYGQNGLDATVEFYKSAEGVQDRRTLILLDEAESTLLIYRNIPALSKANMLVRARHSQPLPG